jgi:hypothetical protein
VVCNFLHLIVAVEIQIVQMLVAEKKAEKMMIVSVGKKTGLSVGWLLCTLVSETALLHMLVFGTVLLYIVLVSC